MVELLSTDPAAVPRVALTDGKGVVMFDDVSSGSSQLIVSAYGFVTSTMRIAKDATGEVVFTLSHGYRAIADLESPAVVGPQLVRVMNDDNRSMDDVLDGESDRRIEPPDAFHSVRSLQERTSSSYRAQVDAGRNASASSTATYTR